MTLDMDSDKNECNTLVSDMHDKQYGGIQPINVIKNNTFDVSISSINTDIS